MDTPLSSDAQCSALAGEIASILSNALPGAGASASPPSLGISDAEAQTIANAIAPLIAAQRLAGGDPNDPAFVQAIISTVQALQLPDVSGPPLNIGSINFVIGLAQAFVTAPQAQIDQQMDPMLANAIPCSSNPSSPTTSGLPTGGDPGVPVSAPGSLPAIPGLDTPPGGLPATPVNGPAPVAPVGPTPVAPVPPVPASPVAVDDGADPCLASAAQEYTLVGRCSTLDAEGGDHTRPCNPTVTLVRIPTGGLAVCFAATDSTRVVFIGTQPTTVDPRTNATSQALDRVRFRIPGGDAGEKAASGTCALGNLNQGVPATIVCRANTDVGAFDGTFVSNGSAPKLAQQ
jgi:hypothetical protein